MDGEGVQYSVPFCKNPFHYRRRVGPTTGWLYKVEREKIRPTCFLSQRFVQLNALFVDVFFLLLLAVQSGLECVQSLYIIRNSHK